MPSFITKICTINNNITTCEYGGVIPYSFIFILGLIIFALFTTITYKIIHKIL